MSTTILTDEQIRDIAVEIALCDQGGLARAIEAAILQSPEIQALREDAERYRAWRKAVVTNDTDFLSIYIEFDDGSPENT